MKTITFYRNDFKVTAEANFFEDLLQSLGIPENTWDTIDEIEIKADAMLYKAS